MANKFFSVKTIYKTAPKGKPVKKDKYYQENTILIEERVVLIRASNIDMAIQKAEKEAEKYVKNDTIFNVYGQRLEMIYTGICDAFELYDDPENNTEIFSSTRIANKKLTKNELADLMLGGKETKNDLKYRKKFLSS